MASTNFKVFNEAMDTDRTFSDSEYAVATQRDVGVIPGMANSRLHNKMYHQATAMPKAIADFLVSQGYDVMDNDIPSITENIEKAITTLIKSKTTEDLTEHNTSEIAHEDIRTAIAEATKKAGLPVGYTYTVDYTELQEGQIPLLGGKYLKSTFADLWKWVQTHPSMIVTEEQWQALSTASGGRAVAKYANVDEQYFRVPLVTTWVRGASSLDEVGAVLEAGLPNITGVMTHQSGGTTDAKGAFYVTDENGNYYISAQSGSYKKLGFDASRTNSIYGKSTTVQPQSVLRLWVVQAFGTNSNTGNMDVAQVAQGISDLTGRVSTIENRGWFTQDLSQNGWCKMPNGLILQWGIGVAGAQGSTQVLTYPIALSRVLHVEVSSVYPSVSGDYDGEWQICNITATSLSVYSQVYDAGCTNPSIPHFFVIGVV